MIRMIPFAPEYTITRSGEVRHASSRAKVVYPGTHTGKYGLTHLTVDLNGERQYVWKILSLVWYDRQLPLQQDGGLLRWDSDDTFVLKKTGSGIIDFEEIQFFWFLYRQQGVQCFRMAEASKVVSYSVEQFKSLIKDILIASIR